MKTLIAVIIGLALITTAYPAVAYVVAVTTSIPAQKVADEMSPGIETSPALSWAGPLSAA